MQKYQCLCFFLYLVCTKAKYEKRSFVLKYKPGLDGFLCEDNIFNLNSGSLIQCGSVCQTNSLCKGIFFDKNSSTCTGCDLQVNEANFGMKSIGEPTLFFERHQDNGEATPIEATLTSYPSASSLTRGTRVFTKTESFTTTDLSTSTDPLTTKGLSATTDLTTDLFTTIDPSETSVAVTTTYPSTTSDPFTTTDLAAATDSVTTTYPSETTDLLTTSDLSKITNYFTTTDLSATTHSTTDRFTTKDHFSASAPVKTTVSPTTTDPFTTNYPMINFNSTLMHEQMPGSQTKELNNSRYLVVFDGDFLSATEKCFAGTNSNQVHLAWVDTAEENEYLAFLVQGIRNGYSDIDDIAFLGLKGDADMLVRFPTMMPQSKYFNRTTTTQYSYSGNKYCVGIDPRGEWVRISCYEVIAAICERELSDE